MLLFEECQNAISKYYFGDITVPARENKAWRGGEVAEVACFLSGSIVENLRIMFV